MEAAALDPVDPPAFVKLKTKWAKIAEASKADRTRWKEYIRSILHMLDAVEGQEYRRRPRAFFGVHPAARGDTEGRPPQRRRKDYLWTVIEEWPHLLPSERYAIAGVVQALRGREPRSEVFVDDLKYGTCVVVRGPARPDAEPGRPAIIEHLERIEHLDRHEEALDRRRAFRLLSFSNTPEAAPHEALQDPA